MKICRIITRLNVGGPARQVKVLKDLPGVETLVLAGRCEDGEREMFEPDVRIEGLGREIGLWNDWKAYRGIKRVLREFRPDLVHTHTSKAGAIGRVAAWRCGVPCVHTYHGHVFHSYFGRVKTEVVKLVEKGLCGISSRVVAISHSQLEEIGEVIGRAKLTLIWNGFDLRPFLQEQEVERDKWSLFVDRNAPIKRRDRFVKYLRDNNLKGVIANGEFSTKQMAWLYKRAKELVICSDNEGVPTCYIEAVASWCPVKLLTCPGGVVDLVKMSREDILSVFRPERLKEDLLKLYKEVLDENSRNRR